jgi:tetratricopeptide (TPR) repeat protein
MTPVSASRVLARIIRVRSTVFAFAILMALGAPGAGFAAPIDGSQPMAELTPDDKKPLQFVDRQDIKHEGKEAFYRAFQAQKSGYWDYAISNYQQAIDANPDMYEAFWNQGICYEQAKKYDKAKEAFATALKIDWQNSLVYKHLAYISFQLGNTEEGKQWLAKYLHR